MQIYVMDCDYEVMKKLESVINLNPKCKAKCFTNTQSLVEAVRKEWPEAVLIDFDAQNSFPAVKIIKDISPNTKIVIMSKDKCKTIHLFELGLTGFLLKPLSNEKIEEQLYGLQHPILAKMKTKRDMRSDLYNRAT